MMRMSNPSITNNWDNWLLRHKIEGSWDAHAYAICRNRSRIESELRSVR